MGRERVPSWVYLNDTMQYIKLESILNTNGNDRYWEQSVRPWKIHHIKVIPWLHESVKSDCENNQKASVLSSHHIENQMKFPLWFYHQVQREIVEDIAAPNCLLISSSWKIGDKMSWNTILSGHSIIGTKYDRKQCPRWSFEWWSIANARYFTTQNSVEKTIPKGKMECKMKITSADRSFSNQILRSF